MSPYAYMNVITLAMFVVAYISSRTPKNKLNALGDRIPNVIGFIIPALVYSLFSGLRRSGGDTQAYTYMVNEIWEKGVKPSIGFGKNKNFDFVMWWTRDLANRVNNPFQDDYQFFILISAFVSLVPVIYILYKYSASYEMAIALFVYTGFFAASINGVRQYFAAGVVVIGTKFLLSEKRSSILGYLPFVLLAYTFHSSSIIMLPLFFLIRRKSFTMTSYIITLAAIIMAVAFDSFLGTFFDTIENTSYSHYATNGWFTDGVEQGASIFRAMVAAVPLVMSYFKLDYIREHLGKKGDMLINLCLFKTVFQILAVYNWIFTRLSVYLDVYYIILFVWLLKHAYAEYDKKIVYGSTVVMFYFYFDNMRYMIDAYSSAYIR